MTDRVSSSNARNHSVEPPPPVPQQASPVIDQAAAEFESLLSSSDTASSDQPVQQRDDRGDAPSSGRDDDGDSKDSAESRRQEAKTDDPKGKQGKAGQANAPTAKKHDLGEGDQKSQQPVLSEPESLSPGEAILQGMGKAENVTTSAQPAALSEGPQGVSQLDQVVQQVADRILVTPPGQAGGAPEVRIMLKDSALPGTEVRITQQAGRLQVSFVTTHGKSHEFLAGHQANLQNQLGDRLPEHSVVVEVEMEGQMEGDSDGRSRQRRNLQEEAEDSSEE